MPTDNLILPQKSLAQDSAHLHVAGESKFVDDLDQSPRQLLVDAIYSPHAKAKITKINFNGADKIPGIACIITAKDLKHNLWGSIFHEQPIIAEEEVNFVGEVVALIAYESKESLWKAKSLLKIEYVLGQAILSLKDAINKQAFIGKEQLIKCGEPEVALQNSPNKLKGEITLGGADHFYLENQSAIAYPQEDGQILVHSSTQHPSETQSMVAEALGINFSAVTCVAKRLGGGFGGKETQAAPIAVYASIVALKTNRPAKLVLSKDDDMIMTGKRNPYLVKYEVAFEETGKLTALSCYFYGDGGAYADLSSSILERAMAHADNAYYLPNAQIKGVVCRTNYHPHTAFRGFGGPKGVAMIEHIMEDIAHFLNKDSLEIRKLNCYQNNNNTTPYGQTFENNILPKLFSEIEIYSDYRSRKNKIIKWNANGSNNPRGISISAIKFGIAFTTRFLNQASSNVHIYRDGSVQVSTGAVEMGQGVQSRIRDLLVEELGIDPNLIKVVATSTDRNPNTSPTAASSGTDLNGSAAVLAVRKIKRRLAQVFLQIIKLAPEDWPQKTAALASKPELEVCKNIAVEDIVFECGLVFSKQDQKHAIDFKVLVEAAYLSRIHLSDVGFYKVPGLNFNKLTGKGNAFLYFTQGVACSEVEIDQYTGEVKLLRSDIIMDLGKTINDALDRGQVAGGFIQGLGWVTSEELVYDSKGLLLTHAPSTYKIPSIHDIPRGFNIELIKNHNNSVNLRGSKAVGEPPLMLCFSVWNALKNALSFRINSQRLANLPVPATPEVLLKFLKPQFFNE